MRNKYQADALAKNVCIVSFCGYDSVPAELALFVTHQELQKANSESKLQSLELVFVCHGGGMPHGTISTILDYFDEAMQSHKTDSKIHDSEFERFVPKAYKSMQKAWLSPLQWVLPFHSPRLNRFTAQNFMACVNVPVLCRVSQAIASSDTT